MRDINAEIKITNRLYLWSGALMVLGLIAVFAGAGAWIVQEFWESWPVFSMMIGLWLTVLGVTLATITGITQRGLH